MCLVILFYITCIKLLKSFHVHRDNYADCINHISKALQSDYTKNLWRRFNRYSYDRHYALHKTVLDSTGQGLSRDVQCVKVQEECAII